MNMVKEGDHQLVVEDDRLSIKQQVNASIERVFACFTQPDLLAKWHAPGTMTVPDVDVNLVVGGAYHVTMKNADGETFTAFGHFREISHPVNGSARLVYSWAWRHVEGSPETLVTVLMSSAGEQTEVELIHEGFASADVSQHHSQGWSGIFARLKAFCE